MSIMVGTGRGAEAGRPDPERRSARAAGEGRHARRRQDRHADRRQAATGRPSSRSRDSTSGRCSSLAASLEHVSEHPLAAAVIGGGARARASSRRRSPASSRQTGRGVTGTVDGPTRSRSAARDHLAERRRRPGAGRSVPTRCGARGRRSCSSRSTAGPRVCSAWPIRSRPARGRQSRRCAARASRSSCSPATTAVTADAVAAAVGIDRVEADVLPDEKAAVVKRLQADGRACRDGRRRHQRRAGAGAGRRRHRHGHRHRRRHRERGHHAREGRPPRHASAPGGSAGRPCANIRQNLFFAFVYNAVGVPIAAGVLYPLARAAAQPDDRERGDDASARCRSSPTRCGCGGWRSDAFADRALCAVGHPRLFGGIGSDHPTTSASTRRPRQPEARRSRHR